MSTTAIDKSDYFNAHIHVLGTQVSINATNVADMLKALAKFGYAVPNLDAAADKVVEKIAEATETKKPAAKKEAAAPVEKSAAVEPPPSSSATPPAPAPTAAPASDTQSTAPTYNEVRDRVLALAKISPDTAKQVLAQFKGVSGDPCDHGNKLQLGDYTAFIAAADTRLGTVA